MKEAPPVEAAQLIDLFSLRWGGAVHAIANQ
jgi:hypothetical protein